MAAPPGSRALVPVLREGDLLAGRYRLVEPVAPGTPDEARRAVLWLAQDEVLARPVAAKVLPAGGRRGARAARPFLAAAAASGAVSHPVLARVYDAAVEERPAERSGRAVGEIDVAYVISEWVDGPGLVRELREEGPYDPAQAVELLEQLAEALAVAHAAGLVHGRVHPGNVLLTSGGAVKLTDLGVASALPDRAVPAERADDPPGPAADVRDLAAVLYAALTARWPATATPQPASGLPHAPTIREGGTTAAPGKNRGRLTSPRQVRAGVPRPLDAVVVRALDPRTAGEAPTLATAAGLAAGVTGAMPPEPVRAAPTPARAPRLPRWLRRLVGPIVVLGALVVLGLTTYDFGLRTGTLDDPNAGIGVIASPGPGEPASTAAQPVELATVPVRDFDPPPGDGRERPGEVANAYDDDPSTAWRTERYDSAAFGGLKQGVGLLVDLSAPTGLTRVELSLEAPGTTVELRAGDTAAENAGGYPRLASGTSGTNGSLVLTPPAGTRARYVLIWITGLPRVDGRFVAGIREMRLLRP